MNVAFFNRVILTKLNPFVRFRVAAVSRAALCTTTGEAHNNGDATGAHSHEAGEGAPEQQTQDEEQEYETEEDVKHRLYLAALSQVSEHGWTRQAIVAGAEVEGLPAVTHGLFPRGGVDLINHFYVQSNLELEEMLKEQKAAIEEAGEKLRVSPFLRNAVQDRLLMVAPYKDTWPQAMGIQALPQNAPTSLRNLADLVDMMWFHAGDQSADMNWYTKRVTLAAVYKSTEIHMLQDDSEDLVDTWLFLERRLKDVAELGKAVAKCKESSSSIADGLHGAKMLLQNVAGVGNRNR